MLGLGILAVRSAWTFRDKKMTMTTKEQVTRKEKTTIAEEEEEDLREGWRG